MMSLMERVQRAQSQNEGPSDSRYGNQADLVDLMREYLQTRMPSYRMARLMAKNPQQARNEIRSICLQGFAEGAYPVLGLTEERCEQAISALLDSVFGLGPLEALLADESITEIMVNGSESLFYERGGIIFRSEDAFQSDEAVRALIDKIIGPLGRRVDESSPMVDARLPQGYRVNAIIPPLSLVGPVLTIRKFSQHVITLEEMVASGSVEESVRRMLVWAIDAECNMAVSGGNRHGEDHVAQRAFGFHSPCAAHRYDRGFG